MPLSTGHRRWDKHLTKAPGGGVVEDVDMSIPKLLHPRQQLRLVSGFRIH